MDYCLKVPKYIYERLDVSNVFSMRLSQFTKWYIFYNPIYSSLPGVPGANNSGGCCNMAHKASQHVTHPVVHLYNWIYERAIEVQSCKKKPRFPHLTHERMTLSASEFSVPPQTSHGDMCANKSLSQNKSPKNKCFVSLFSCIREMRKNWRKYLGWGGGSWGNITFLLTLGVWDVMGEEQLIRVPQL